ncbi:hypothetical protein [Legionella longbeachae]|uniref:Uncharacterized protein n=1 Tax=Legionella longbeachae serogroup 1 (strain NSW150) TaxID=661367 RepID=D3HLT0_LEGLN|nr:hypothetical protein [Legionella longbeachae]HBD7397376.1 hypothetical protein [Legionella pneumophila]ARB93297.1 hypothetical protein A6J40_14430 [Legionella longbeachae]ARM33639.1 hypothetical protein B0B39_08910 [Legionella longbeachae]EEZ93527.1 hypothetical protein LLB_2413 [Legionella longbeachae D-4968]QIN33509.1 hypothetical protein GCB94_15820 [Legionella longbeachae]
MPWLNQAVANRQTIGQLITDTMQTVLMQQDWPVNLALQDGNKTNLSMLLRLVPLITLLSAINRFLMSKDPQANLPWQFMKLNKEVSKRQFI